MRLKHVKGAHERVEKSSYILLTPEEHKGKYHDLFQNDHPIHLEIGMGKGNFLIENAKKYPNINFIGIEKYDSVMVRAVEKLEKENLTNIKLIRMDAVEIEKIFSKEIDTIYLNFSDPWPKDKHEKRRLTSANFLKRYDQLFEKEAKIKCKTDNRKLFEYSLISLTNYGYKMEELSLSLHDDSFEENIMTEYEQKWVEKNVPIYYVFVRKN